MQVMESGDVSGNDKVAGVRVWVGSMWEFTGAAFCVTDMLEDTVIENRLACYYLGVQMCVCRCVSQPETEKYITIFH